MTNAPAGILALFPSPQALVDAIPKLRDRGYGEMEAFTPYPVHGLDAAIGLKPSPLGYIVIVMGVLGALSAILFEWWTSAVDYPLHIGGKVLFSWQAFVPVMFELTVLFATFTAGLGMLHLMARLPFFGNPVLNSTSMAAITRDRFALLLRGHGAADADAAREALLQAGAESVEILGESLRVSATSPRFWGQLLAAVTVACVVAGYGTYRAIKLFPELPPMVHMERQPKLMPQRADAFFKDGRGMLEPVPGTVARGHMPYLIKTPEEAAKVLMNPLPTTEKVLQRGRFEYENHCQTCHGQLGDGHPMLDQFYGAKPADLQSATVRAYPDGWIYHVITEGKNSMPSYAADISPDDRWAIVHYVRALQRSQHAAQEDLK